MYHFVYCVDQVRLWIRNWKSTIRHGSAIESVEHINCIQISMGCLDSIEQWTTHTRQIKGKEKHFNTFKMIHSDGNLSLAITCDVESN